MQLVPGTACRGLLTEMAPDMLTPVDQPLDKLDDLTPEELCVFFYPSLRFRGLMIFGMQRQYARYA